MTAVDYVRTYMNNDGLPIGSADSNSDIKSDSTNYVSTDISKKKSSLMPVLTAINISVLEALITSLMISIRTSSLNPVLTAVLKSVLTALRLSKSEFFCAAQIVVGRFCAHKMA